MMCVLEQGSVLDVCVSTLSYLLSLQNEVESLRLKTTDYEMIVAQHGDYSLVVFQDTQNKPTETAEGGEEGEEKKEG